MKTVSCSPLISLHFSYFLISQCQEFGWGKKTSIFFIFSHLHCGDKMEPFTIFRGTVLPLGPLCSVSSPRSYRLAQDSFFFFPEPNLTPKTRLFSSNFLGWGCHMIGQKDNTEVKVTCWHIKDWPGFDPKNPRSPGMIPENNITWPLWSALGMTQNLGRWYPKQTNKKSSAHIYFLVLKRTS